MKITKYVKGGYDYVHHGPSAYDKMRENGELDSMYYGEGGFWNQPSNSKPEEEKEQQPVEGQEDFVIDFDCCVRACVSLCITYLVGCAVREKCMIAVDSAGGDSAL